MCIRDRVIGVVDTERKQAELVVIGDGLIAIDGTFTEFDQGDKPDYFAYHLGRDFNDWLNAHNQWVSVSVFSDLAITTDGIFSFKNFKQPQNQKSEDEIISYLLTDKEGAKSAQFLDNKLIDLEEIWNHVATDDLAIIRIIAP